MAGMEMHYSTLQGTDFNRMAYARKLRLVKVLRPSLKHYDFTYEPNAMNILQGEFNPDPNCKPDGLYFCNSKHVWKWVTFLNADPLFASVEIPDRAIISVCQSDEKYKTDMLYLGQPMTADLFFSDEDILRMSDTSVSQLFACSPFPRVWSFMKRVHNLTSNRSGTEPARWAAFVRCAATNADYEFLDSIKVHVHQLLNYPPYIILLIAELRALSTPWIIAKLIEWFETNFPESCELVVAVLRVPYPFPQNA